MTPVGLRPEELARLAAAAAAPGQPAALLGAVEQVAAERIGCALFTAMRFDPAAMEVERLYSSDPAHYPLGGRKRKRDTAWAEHVLVRREVFVGRGEAAIRAAFDDAERILGLGLRGVINVPVTRAGRCVGTLNFLTARESLTEEDVSLARDLARAAAPAFEPAPGALRQPSA